MHLLVLAGTKAILEVEGGIQGWVEREGGEQGTQPEQACHSSSNPWILPLSTSLPHFSFPRRPNSSLEGGLTKFGAVDSVTARLHVVLGVLVTSDQADE